MTSPPPWARGAVAADESVLVALRAERPIARLIDAYGPYGWPLQPPFHALVRAVVAQSVSSASAAAVFGRLQILGATDSRVLLDVGREPLRAAGLSWSKVDTLRRLAELERAGALRGVEAWDDAEVTSRLTRLRGVGPWTADMFLLFCLGRMDVWPVGDLAVRQQIQRLYGVSGRGEVARVGERFRPYRSAVAWYMWRVSREPAA